jgi:hypothetical protein
VKALQTILPQISGYCLIAVDDFAFFPGFLPPSRSYKSAIILRQKTEKNPPLWTQTILQGLYRFVN